ncbi:hypothetical protein TOPH_00642 [Tolypocladium ophioglossoides CBS 100239]|uniref:Uncharacterized protein n=1 Tax=Tolypocladium ophioglossoides (strain CBS 100239) TaxID=1163406 RepID=A0A0L0NN07_TOLOC|nr:hypothetical protein TOPH_00642 [Tolypocladium ophioglossoides CBS 100239]
MPSLGGFLKKKRTRDSNPDPSTSNPTSPVAATTSSKPFDSTSSQQRSSAFSSGSQQQAGTAAQPGPPATSSSAHAQVPAAGPGPTQQPTQQQQMNPVGAQQGASYATTQHDPQNLPTIRNLIHQQPQNDGAATNNNTNTFHPPSPYSLGHPMNHTQSASPGTDPSRMQQQLEQAYPHPPTMHGRFGTTQVNEAKATGLGGSLGPSDAQGQKRARVAWNEWMSKGAGVEPRKALSLASLVVTNNRQYEAPCMFMPTTAGSLGSFTASNASQALRLNGTRGGGAADGAGQWQPQQLGRLGGHRPCGNHEAGRGNRQRDGVLRPSLCSLLQVPQLAIYKSSSSRGRGEFAGTLDSALPALLQAKMDDYMFQFYIDECRVVDEATSYVEIFNYSDPSYNSCEEHPLTEDEFDNFLHQRGAFSPPHKMGEGTELLSGIRLVVQKNAQEKDTFTPKVISLPKDSYEKMVRVLKLPFRAIETTAVVGPFFWCAYDQDDDDPHLQIVHRKSDVRKRGRTRGCEMMLSHSFRTNITTGYVKGTPSSDIVRALDHVRACAAQVGHPMLLPIVVFSYDLSPANDQKQRDARDWLRRLESAVSLRNEVEEHEQYFQDGLLEVDGLSRDLVECHGHVMWKRPQAYWALAREMECAMEKFRVKWSAHEGLGEHLAERQRAHRKEIDKIHRSMLARLEFYKVKLKGLENYIHTTLERLNVQRRAVSWRIASSHGVGHCVALDPLLTESLQLYNIMSQREARLNLEIAGEQRRIAHASKRDSTAMKTISLMGALFLPGTYLASVFSMTFFNFQGGGNPMVASQLWIYFVVTIPLTAAIVGFWWWFDRRREARYARDDEDLEKNIDRMEKDIMFHLRKRTMSKANTWNTLSSPPPP